MATAISLLGHRCPDRTIAQYMHKSSKLISFMMPCLVVTCTTTASAAPTYVVDVRAAVAQTVYGPTTVQFIGFNPVRFTASVQGTRTTTPLPLPGFVPKSLVSPTVDSINADLVDAVSTTSKTRIDIAIFASQVDQDLKAGSNMDVVATAAVAQQGDARRDILKLQQETLPALEADAASISKLNTTSAMKADLAKSVSSQTTDSLSVLQSYLFLGGPLSAADFSISAAPENCGGLMGRAGTTTETLTLTDRQNPAKTSTYSVTVACPSAIALSAGFIFSGLRQHTFAAIPNNTALPAPPVGQPTPPPATVQDTNRVAFRPLPFAFVHLALQRQCMEHCLFASFGAGLNGSTSGANVDFATGLTYGVFRYMYLTAGLHLGQTTEPAAGYSVGSPIAVGASVPTVTRTQSAFFLGISFGTP